MLALATDKNDRLGCLATFINMLERFFAQPRYIHIDGLGQPHDRIYLPGNEITQAVGIVDLDNFNLFFCKRLLGQNSLIRRCRIDPHAFDSLIFVFPINQAMLE